MYQDGLGTNIGKTQKRVAFLQEKHGTKGASILKEHDLITKNVFINGYNGVWTIDHDDGSQYFNDTENFMIFGGCKNYLGNSYVYTHHLFWSGFPMFVRSLSWQDDRFYIPIAQKWRFSQAITSLATTM